MKNIAIDSTNSASWDEEAKFSLQEVVQFLRVLPALSNCRISFGRKVNGDIIIIVGNLEYTFVWD